MLSKTTQGHHGIHWLAPTTILLSLATGILIAVGHHLFYRSLEGKQVQTNTYEVLGSNVSSQQLNLAIGTAFAFLVKAALVTAVSTAYIQLLWRTLLRAVRGSTLGNLDAVFSGLSNIISLSKIWIWRHYPLLFLLAILAGLLPLAAIITPATLSIEAGQVLPAPSSMRSVPSLGFESLDYIEDMPSVYDGNASDSLRFAYVIPSSEVIEIAKAVAATGSILPITPPSSNASWTMDFPGPALQCTNVSEPLASTIWSNIASALNASSSCTAYGFVSWLTGMPFIGNSNGSDYTFHARTFQGSPMLGALYIAAVPRMMEVENYGALPAGCSKPVQSLLQPSGKSSEVPSCSSASC